MCAGDFDNDGWTDLYVTNIGRNRLYRNNRNGGFTDIAGAAGVALGGWSSGCAFGDFDADGLLDLFVAGYVKFDVNHPPPPATRTQTKKEDPVGRDTIKSQPVGIGATYQAGRERCVYRGQPVMCGPRGLDGEPDHLFRNNGNGTFSDVSAQAGVADNATHYGIGVAWFDFDDDGKLDLMVANDSTELSLSQRHHQGSGRSLRDVITLRDGSE